MRSHLGYCDFIFHIPELLGNFSTDINLSNQMKKTGLFNMQTIEKWLDDHQSGRKEYSAPLWTLLMFASFYKQVQQG